VVKIETNGDPDIKAEPEESHAAESTFVDEVKIGDKTLFTIPLNMKFDEADYLPKERKTRWG
jgi:hypothetical protein